MRVAVLGLGRMGGAAARRFAEAGHDVSGWNRTPGRAGELPAAVHRADSAEDAAREADVVITAVSDDRAVRAVLLETTGPLGRPDTVVVDCSTVSPQTAGELAAAYPGRFVAAPILGAPAAVAAGEATILVGGDEHALAAAGPVLNALGSLRPLGSEPSRPAQLKILANYLLMAQVLLLADAAAAARAVGFEEDEIVEHLGALPLVAPALRNRLAGVAGRNHDGWFSVALAVKDLDLFTGLTETAGADPALLATVITAYRRAAETGWSDADITAVAEVRRPAGP